MRLTAFGPTSSPTRRWSSQERGIGRSIPTTSGRGSSSALSGRRLDKGGTSLRTGSGTRLRASTWLGERTSSGSRRRAAGRVRKCCSTGTGTTYRPRRADPQTPSSDGFDGAERLYPAPTGGAKRRSRDRPAKRRATSRGYLAPREGLEPPTRRLEGDRSIQLSYRGVACDGSRPAAHDRGTTRCVDTPSPRR